LLHGLGNNPVGNPVLCYVTELERLYQPLQGCSFCMNKQIECRLSEVSRRAEVGVRQYQFSSAGMLATRKSWQHSDILAGSHSMKRQWTVCSAAVVLLA